MVIGEGKVVLVWKGLYVVEEDVKTPYDLPVELNE